MLFQKVLRSYEKISNCHRFLTYFQSIYKLSKSKVYIKIEIKFVYYKGGLEDNAT